MQNARINRTNFPDASRRDLSTDALLGASASSNLKNVPEFLPEVKLEIGAQVEKRVP